MRILYIIPVIAILVLLYYVVSSNRAGINDELPKRFIQYHPLDSLKSIKSGAATLNLLVESTEDIESFLTPENNIILSIVPDKEEKFFFKLNPEGQVIDSLKLNSDAGDIAFLKGFIINMKTHRYHLWSFNGSKLPIKITAQNADFKWDIEKQRKQLTDIARKSNTVRVDYEKSNTAPYKPDSEGLRTAQVATHYSVITYCINDVCFQFYTTLDVSKQFPWSYREKMLWNNLFKRINKEAISEVEISKTPYIKYWYFQKLKREEVQFSGGGGNAPGFREILYHGNLYTDVVFNKDTLRLREFMYLNEESHTSDIEIDGKNIGALSKNKEQPTQDIRGYLYYTNEKLHYALFTNNDKKVYLIK
ncbi:hypothetical protein ATE47_01645 [Chryseobacterium sp. IHB B 17019]|uniref:hypothetical protein n=1 Tax=Chryseobacterium sp. IHB B 17019 TaxID=1721091 RepID=UPI000720B8E4|nr:hypothetical protein [Chryseobacterium sp. IHB B 17019]ALR29315.1 hypothetical protein ATE47_01645 [Chryseobacterium sp. IHB B 17019]